LEGWVEEEKPGILEDQEREYWNVGKLKNGIVE